MCGIVAIAGLADAFERTRRALPTLHHRGPDGSDAWHSGTTALGHTRLAIIDLSDAGRQPMVSADGRYVITFNGEVYNYLELRAELADYPFRSQTDTEVVLAAWSKWGESCLDRMIGMFAFAIWDSATRELIAVRDRFGVKPLYVAAHERGIVLASEIKALKAAGIDSAPDPRAWATYLATGTVDPSRTFWTRIDAVPAGHVLRWRDGACSMRRWYDLAARVGELDDRPLDVVKREYLELLEASVRLRFRSDVPVGINLSGGVDSSTLLGLVHAVRGADSAIEVFTFATGDDRYDELPWVRAMLEHTRHPHTICSLAPADVPELAARIAAVQDEPFGGLPTLAYATLFAHARQRGVIVLLDGQGLDEQWAGYDYYRTAGASVIQGAQDPTTRADCLAPGLRELATRSPSNAPFPDQLRNLQLRDLFETKLPRALRYNDRVSMAASTELREPFLDHRLVELAMRQPADRKIRGEHGKWLLREIAAGLLPDALRQAPKRPLQTPQREWLRGPLESWANDLIERAFETRPEWFDVAKARAAWRSYVEGRGDNSFWVWQWLSISLG